MPMFFRWLALGAVVLALDLYTKQLVLDAFEYAEHLYINEYFDLVRYHNTGAAFSFLANAGGWQQVFFSTIALVASVVIIHLLRKHSTETLFCVGLALILGGALGNLYDRLTLGYVVDFLYFHYERHAWPAFNVADSAITVGVALLLWDSFRKSRKPAAAY